jgi:type IV pilus assembly protein PilN
MVINFLPHRKWNLARKRKNFATCLAVCVLAALVLGAGSNAVIGRQLTAQKSANNVLQSEIAVVDKALKNMTQVNEDIVKLNVRETTLQTLQDEGKRSAVWLQEVAEHLPDGLYLTALKQDGDKVSIQGVARTNEQVFELQQRITREGQWLAQAELVEVTGASLNIDALGLTGVPFAMRAMLKRIEQQAGSNSSQHPSATP